VLAAEACRWTTKVVPYAPYVTSLDWITHYGAKYVVHGDDITSDAGGEDCYRYVKAAGRFKVVKRTPGISTTDLVGRMLLCRYPNLSRLPFSAMSVQCVHKMQAPVTITFIAANSVNSFFILQIRHQQTRAC
jgi:glycerol-3-phosphate cytidylyltransferase-like family protein